MRFSDLQKNFDELKKSVTFRGYQYFNLFTSHSDVSDIPHFDDRSYITFKHDRIIIYIDIDWYAVPLTEFMVHIPVLSDAFINKPFISQVFEGTQIEGSDIIKKYFELNNMGELRVANNPTLEYHGGSLPRLVIHHSIECDFNFPATPPNPPIIPKF